MEDKSIKMKGRRETFPIGEDTVVRACQAYEKNFEVLGKYKAMSSAIKIALVEIFRGDLSKAYEREIKKLKLEIEQLKGMLT